jgi:hypothetical protein
VEDGRCHLRDLSRRMHIEAAETSGRWPVNSWDPSSVRAPAWLISSSVWRICTTKTCTDPLRADRVCRDEDP